MAETPEQPPVFNGGLEDLFTEEFAEQPAAETETPQPEAPEAPEQEQPAEPTPAQPEAPEPETEETPAEQPQTVEWGRFKGQTYEDILQQQEDSRKNAERMATQRAQEAAEERRQREQLMSALRQAEPLIRQAAAMQQPNLEELDTSDPQVVQQLIDQRAAQIAQQQVAQQLAPIQEQQERDRYEAGMREIQEYRQAHPDSGTYDSDVMQIVQDYRFDGQEEIFPPTRDNLETALTLAQNPGARSLLDTLNLHPEKEWVQHAVEVASNPSLQTVVMAHPHVIETDAGMKWARQQAGLPEVVQQAQVNAVTNQALDKQQERKAAHVETGGGEGDLAPGRKPKDPLDEAYQEAIAGDAKGAIFR